MSKKDLSLGWKKGDFAIRKGRLCQILSIDRTINPPFLCVKMLDDNNVPYEQILY